MRNTLRRSTGEPITVTDVIEAGRRMVGAATPSNPREIQERMGAVEVVMGYLNGPNYGTDFYRKLGAEWSRLSALLSDGSLRGVPVSAGWATRAAGGSRSAEQYAADEAAWQRELDRRGGDPGWNATRLPASWRLPDPPRAKVEVPSIRLDADADPRVTVSLPRRAFEVIEAACIRSGDHETGGWLSGHQPRNWHRDRGIIEATVAVRHSSTDSVVLDTDEFVRWDAKMRADRRGGDGEFRALGGWHSHPVGAATPSAGDLDCWACRLATLIDPESSLTTLIVGRRDPHRDSWRNPRITAWITRHARSSFGARMICEPAIVSVR